MTAFGTQGGLPDQRARRRGGSDRRFAETVGVNRSLTVPGSDAAGPGAFQNQDIAQLVNLLGSAANTADRSIALIERQSARNERTAREFAEQMRGEARTRTRAIAPGLLQSIQDGGFDEGLGESDPEVMAAEIAASRFEGMPKAFREQGERDLTPLVAAQLVSRQTALQEAERDESNARSVEAIIGAGAPEEIQQSLGALRDRNPDLGETEILRRGVLPALENAALRGDREKFNALKSALGDRLPGEAAKYEARLTETVQSQEREEIAQASQQLAGVFNRLRDGEITTEQAEAQIRERAGSDTQLLTALESLDAVQRRADAERINRITTPIGAAAEAGNAEQFNRLVSQVPEEDRGPLAEYIEAQRNELDRNLNRLRQRAMNDAANTVSQFVRDDNLGGAETYIESLRARGQIDNVDADRLLGGVIEIQRDLLDQRAQRAFDEQSLRHARDMFDAAMPINDAETLLPSGKTRKISNEDLRAAAYQSSLAERFGQDQNGNVINPLVSTATGLPVDRQQVENHIRMLVQTGHQDENLRAVLTNAGNRLAPGVPVAEINDRDMAAFQTFRILDGQGLAQRHADATTMAIFRNASNIISTNENLSPAQALGLAYTRLTQDPLTGQARIPSIPIRDLELAVGRLNGGRGNDPYAGEVLRQAAITNMIVQPGLSVEQSLKLARESVERDYVAVNGHLFNTRDLQMGKDDIRFAGGALIDYFDERINPADAGYRKSDINIMQHPNGMVYLTNEDRLIPEFLDGFTANQFRAIASMAAMSQDIRTARKELGRKGMGIVDALQSRMETTLDGMTDAEREQLQPILLNMLQASQPSPEPRSGPGAELIRHNTLPASFVDAVKQRRNP